MTATVHPELAINLMAHAAQLLGVNPGSIEVAEVMALAYGNACGMLAAAGADVEVFDTLNAAATGAAFAMARRVCSVASPGATA